MRRLRRTIIAFAVVTLFVLIIGFIYNTFLGHGVTSPSMAHAYFYPLFLGVLLNAMLFFAQKRLPFVGTVGYRLYSNIYNAGIGTLTIFSILTGVLDIAGTDSELLTVMQIAGWAVVASGLMVLIVLLIKTINAKKRLRISKIEQRKSTQDFS